ncbi:peptidase, M24 family [Teladorsagia circumcincta]|uniref:Xaa-Pro dipeptidase n=1 Tax=Teladorsagia circumcincta TaxID=45464 RepID=A0A2G9UCI2_TELCI|nr:peptidase, M24 family [Teladorsagia circumcincta]
MPESFGPISGGDSVEVQWGPTIPNDIIPVRPTIPPGAISPGGPPPLPDGELFAGNRTRLVAALKNAAPGSVVVLQGGIEKNRYNTDAGDLPFRQESYFFWTFGVHESGAENTDSGNVLEPPAFPGKELFDVDVNKLYSVMAELRVFKTDKEMEVMSSSCYHESDPCYTSIKWKVYSVSYYHGGCRHLAYTCIAATGCNGSILHYGHANAPNDKQIKDGDMCLFDMGPEYNCYASDVTTSFPANGKFTEKQKIVYNAVLEANQAVFKAAKPGVRWTDMHLFSEKVILTHLQKAGLLTGDIDEMVNARLGAVFMPHGLGHLIGLDVHDCGGYLGDALPRSELPGLSSLRATRTLKEGMVITIEPGCYFIDTLLDAAFKDPKLAKFLVKAEIDKYRGQGGVRIEDDVVIWEKGNENMSDVPRTIEEIEHFMAMNTALIVVLAGCAVFWVVFGEGQTEKPLPPPFLSAVNDTVRREFYDILMNVNLTQEQRKSQVLGWIAKFGLEDEAKQDDDKLQAMVKGTSRKMNVSTDKC